MKIFIQNTTNKFINNLTISLREMGIDNQCLNIQQDLYRIYHYYPFETAVFLASQFNNEIAQFITEFYSSKRIKFYIYHDEHKEDLISLFGSAAKHLVNTPSQGNTLFIPELINHFLFHDLKISTKKNKYAIFLDEAKEIPEALNEKLYPNTKHQIVMFNNRSIQHPQNLGLISEVEKAKILNTYVFFIDINHNYAHEARACGSIVVDLDTFKKSRKTNKTIKPIQTYEEFIRTNIL